MILYTPHSNPQLCDFLQTVGHAFNLRVKTQAPRRRERKSKRIVSKSAPTVFLQTATER